MLCVDPKPSKQVNQGMAPVLPMTPRQVEKHLHDYIRHGITDPFAAVDVLPVRVIGDVPRRHAIEFRPALNTIERSMPKQFELHLLLDNPSIYKTPLMQRWIGRQPRVRLPLTPIPGTWLNLAKCCMVERPGARHAAVLAQTSVASLCRGFGRISPTPTCRSTT